MLGDEQDHECDLFLLSSHHGYAADHALSQFARRGRRNVHGWGLGSYVDGRARTIRSELPATGAGESKKELSREFAVAVQAVSSAITLGHLRLTSRGSTRRENNHPFVLNFLGYDWLLIHNGSARRHNELIPETQRLLLNSDSDTPRVFEYLRRQIIDYYLNQSQGETHMLSFLDPVDPSVALV